MSNITTMNGGLLLNDTYESKSIEDAINFFKSNSTFSILTNSSLSCITFKAVLKPPVESPFIHIRSGIIEQPVRTLLFKYFPINTLNSEEAILFITHKTRGGFPYISLSKAKIIEKEYNVQLQVYQTTYNTISSAYEPVCPYPILCFTDLNKDKTIQEIKDRLDNTKEDTENKRIITEITDTLGGAIDNLITNTDKASIEYIDKAGDSIKKEKSEARALITTLGCIVMEFMDEYTTLQEYLDRHSIVNLMTNPETKKQKFIEVFGQSEYDEYEKNFVPLKPGKYGPDTAFDIIFNKVSHKAKSLVAYELVRLKEIGFLHGDLHYGNIMYNPNYKYITNDDDEYTGRALLIDFGHSVIDKKKLVEFEKSFYLAKTYNKDEAVYAGIEKELKFHHPYTFKEIYRRRLEVTLKFRETMIQDLESLLTTSLLSTAERKKKAKLKLDLITNLKWPTNFDKSKVDDFKKEEFDAPFKEVRDPIFETSKELIQTFTQKLDNIRPKVQALIELKEPEPAAKPPAAEPPAAEPPPAELETPKPSPETLNPLLKSNAKALTQLEHLTNKFKIIFSPLFFPTPSAHGGRRYIHSHKKHKKHKKHKNQTDFSNRLKHRIRTTLRIKRRQTKRGKRGKRRKRSKKGKRGKRSKRKQ